MQHHFDIEIAEKYGINVAIFLNHLSFWIKRNQANNKHCYDGRFWTYNSVNSYGTLFPYWTTKQMRLVLDKVKSCGLVVTNNYNRSSYDRTQWYSLSDLGHQLVGLAICPLGQMDSRERTNQFVEKGEPIPDNKAVNIHKEQRASKNKARLTLLSKDYNPKPEHTALADKRRVNFLKAYNSFIEHYSTKNIKKPDWDKEFTTWLTNESPKSSNEKQEVKSTVKDFDPEQYRNEVFERDRVERERRKEEAKLWN